MKLSELISEATEALAAYGDISVAVDSTGCVCCAGSVEPADTYVSIADPDCMSPLKPGETIFKVA